MANEILTNETFKPLDRGQSAEGGNPCFVMSRSFLLCKFDHIASSKQLSGNSLKREANIFFSWAMVKGYTECPFPEWLVKFSLGNWDPFEE